MSLHSAAAVRRVRHTTDAQDSSPPIHPGNGEDTEEAKECLESMHSTRTSTGKEKRNVSVLRTDSGVRTLEKRTSKSASLPEYTKECSQTVVLGVLLPYSAAVPRAVEKRSDLRSLPRKQAALLHLPSLPNPASRMHRFTLGLSIPVDTFYSAPSIFWRYTLHGDAGAKVKS